MAGCVKHRRHLEDSLQRSCLENRSEIHVGISLVSNQELCQSAWEPLARRAAESLSIALIPSGEVGSTVELWRYSVGERTSMYNISPSGYLGSMGRKGRILAWRCWFV